MSGIQVSPQHNLQGNLNVTRRKESGHGRAAMAGLGKALSFGDDGMAFIDSILSREETEDVISMMIDADESKDCLRLPSFCTSSQMGGGNQLRRPSTPSFSPLLSPVRVTDGLAIIEGIIPGFSTGNGDQMGMDIENDVRAKNHRNVNTSSASTEIISEQSDWNEDDRSDPGTAPAAVNSTAAVGLGGRDPGSAPNKEVGMAGGTVTKHVAMGKDVATAGLVDTHTDVAGEQNEGLSDELSGDLYTPARGDKGADGGDTGDDTKVSDEGSSRLDTILSKMDLVEEILAMMGEKSTKLDGTVKNLEASLEFSQHEIDILKKENEELKKKVWASEIEDKRTQFQVNMIDDKVDILETSLKKKNLIFEGVSEFEGRREDVEKTSGYLFDQLAVGKGIYFDACYRMDPYVKGRSRPILVAFDRQSDRDLLYAKRMELRQTADYQRVWVNEDLGPASKRKRGIIRLIAKEATLQGIDCKSGKYSLHIDRVKYDADNLDELPPKLHLTHLKQVQVNKTTLAYQSKHAPLSNFYPCQVQIGKHMFFCVEQAFYFIHAKTLNKHLAATRIYLSRDVRFIKQLGSEIGTSPEWEASQFDVMYACIKKKFEQNRELRELLLKTGNLELVEATPDTLWGCGATLSSNVIRRREWKGRNKQGEILMVVREELRQRGFGPPTPH